MAKSIAYIGMSSPLGYDYEVEREFGRPNPILEAPLPLFLLYDEIWFLHHEMCPKNMENLGYVRILSDEQDITDYMEEVENLSEEDILDSSKPELGRRLGDNWETTMQNIAPYTDTYDDHSRNSIGGYGHSRVSYGNFLLDQYVSEQLGVDYVSNSAIKDYVTFDEDATTDPSYAIGATQKLVSKRIPQYQSQAGPYFDDIDDFRNSSYIEEFRKKLRGEGGEVSAEELEYEYNRIRNRMTRAATSKKNIYDGIAQLFLDVTPGISETLGTIVDIKEILHSHSRAKKYGWVNLLTEIEDAYAEPPEVNSGDFD